MFALVRHRRSPLGSWFLAVALALSGCSTISAPARSTQTAQGQGTAMLPQDPAPEAGRFVSQFAPASTYRSESTLDEHPSSVARLWFGWLGERGLQPSTGLSRVAEDARVLLRNQGALKPALRDGLMAWHGQLAVDVTFLRLSGQGEPEPEFARSRDTLLSALPQEGQRREVGIAFSQGAQSWELVVVYAQPRAILEPFPKQLSLGASTMIKGTLTPGRDAPVMMIVGPRGQGEVVALEKGADGYSASFRCNRGPGRYQMEWVAQGEMGPEVLVNVPIYCEVPLPKLITYREERLAPDMSRQAIERASWELVNRVRQSQGLHPLVWDPELARLARAHSVEMEQLDYVGHRSPQRGSFDMRLDEAGIQAPLALENVASGFGPQEILERLMASPGHRFNILNPKVTHLGVGVAIRTTLGAQSQDSLFLTQHFARWDWPQVRWSRQRPTQMGAGSP